MLATMLNNESLALQPLHRYPAPANCMRQVRYILNQNTRSVQHMVAPLHMRVSRSRT